MSASAIDPDQIVIVTGLPRSGTSMMMKMLEAGGVPPLCDGQRTADRDNPNGYYEYEAVKQTKQDPGWLEHAPGRAVKMVYSLLYDLPNDLNFHVLFMRRRLTEILASQRTMLNNMGIESAVSDERMSSLFDKEIQRFQQWLPGRVNMKVLEVPYNDVARGLAAPIQQINRHLGGRLNTAAMEAVVDPRLYRNRAA